MKIVVYLRQVFGPGYDPVSPDRRGLAEEGAWFDLHPIDAQALEQALLLAESVPSTEITVIAAGPERVERVLRAGLAAGASRAIRVASEALEQPLPDDISVAISLAQALKDAGIPDWLVCGDGEDSAVPALLAELLNLPLSNALNDLALEGTAIRASRRLQRTTQQLVLQSPRVLGVLRGPMLRYPSLSQRHSAAIAQIETMSPEPAQQGTLLCSERTTAPKPIKKPEALGADANQRVLDLFCGGVSGGGGSKQVLDGSVEEMADTAASIAVGLTER